MGRSWQFLAVVAIIVGMGMVFYYSSDFYAERAARGPAAEAQRTATPVESVGAVAPAEVPPLAEETPAAPAQAGAAAP